MTAVVPSVTDDVMEALQTALKPEVDALARESVLAEMRKAQDTMKRFYWSPDTYGDRFFEPVVDNVFGPGVWDRGMVVEVDPVIAARVSLAPVPPVPVARERCECRHCRGYRDGTCRGNCDRCDDRTCAQCNPDGRLENDDEGDERTCECVSCEDGACQGDCDTCEDHGCDQCHPNLRTCCGYCDRCDMCHTEQAEYGEGYCAECEHCRECDHYCDVDN
jgi:hypothetical protein